MTSLTKRFFIGLISVVAEYILITVVMCWAPALSINDTKSIAKITTVINKDSIQITKLSPIEEYDNATGQIVTYLDSDSIEHVVFIQYKKEILHYNPVKVYKVFK